MIIVDYSSTLHRKIHTSIKATNPKKDENNLYNTKEFINLTKYMILQDLFSVQQQYSNKYGELVIALDDKDNQYWRKTFYPLYKSNRATDRQVSEINYPEVFKEINIFTEELKQNTPWKVFSVDTAEADDIMLVLADTYNKYEPILIYSPDKDMIQAQIGTDNVKQFSSLTNKWLTADGKSGSMDNWINEHCVLGDACDGVPKVTDGTVFSDNFIKYLKENNINELDPLSFRDSDISTEVKRELIDNYDLFKYNRKGENTGIKDVYNNPKFGPAALKKKIKEFDTVQNWLNTNPLYQEHYDRNYTLVMQEGIPESVRTDCIEQYKNAKTEYNFNEFELYLKNNNLNTIIMELPNYFKITKELSADDFGW